MEFDKYYPLIFFCILERRLQRMFQFLLDYFSVVGVDKIVGDFVL